MKTRFSDSTNYEVELLFDLVADWARPCRDVDPERDRESLVEIECLELLENELYTKSESRRKSK